jgi:hypothetical protein
MRTLFVGTSVLAAAAVSLLGARPARACGGCLQRPAPVQTTVVTGHRMAFSVSQEQTVLWDQIEYSGSPSDFAWVLPVRAGAKVELSHDEFFAALDAMTDPVIKGPTPNCGNGGSGGGCLFGGASSNAAGGFAAETPGNQVQVLNQGVVGPYDTVTVHSTDPNALYQWLVTNNYDIPPSVRPIIDAYVAEGSDFLALRLAPGQGVQAMKPVRVVTPGAGLTLPLRMVAAGVGANVGITLYVLGDGRYEAQNFSNGTIDDSKLVWVTAQSQSNYQTLAANVMAGNGGRTWLTEYAQAVSVLGDASTVASSHSYSCGGPGSSSFNYYGSGSASLGILYYGTCLCQSQPLCGQTLVAPVGPDDASLDALLDQAASGEAATDAPAESSGDDASAEASSDDAAGEDAQGDAAAASEAGPYEGGLIAPDGGCTTACDGFDDLAVASVGLDPSNVWVTRLRAQVPSNVLTEGDLVLQASSSQTAVSNLHSTSVYDDPAYNPCGNSGGGGACAASDPPLVVPGRVLVGGAFAFLGFALVRRRRAARGDLRGTRK